MNEPVYNPNDWYPIKCAPEDGKRILLYGKPNMESSLEIVTGWFEEGGTWGWCDSRGHDFYPTHWMPLPSPPLVQES